MRPFTGLLCLVMLLLSATGVAEAAVIIIKYRPVPDGVVVGAGMSDQEADQDGDGILPPQPSITLPGHGPTTAVLPSVDGGRGPQLGTGGGDPPAQGGGKDSTSTSSSTSYGTKRAPLQLGLDEQDDPALAPTADVEEDLEGGGCGGLDPDPGTAGALGLLALVGTLRRRKRG